MSKRIFATVDDEDFRGCVDRGRAEGLDLGQVLSRLCHEYATYVHTDKSTVCPACGSNNKVGGVM